MSKPKVKEADVNALLSSGRLSVGGTHKWTQAGDRCWFKANIPVDDAERRGPSLRITVTVNFLDHARCTFSLLWNKRFRVRALCIDGNHTNKHTNAEKWFHKTHKHKWSDVCDSREGKGDFVDSRESNLRCALFLPLFPPFGVASVASGGPENSFASAQ